MAKSKPRNVRRRRGSERVHLGILGTRRGIAFAEAAAQLPGVEVAGFCGRDLKRGKLIRELFPRARLYDSYEQMLDDSAVNAVVCANYADEHAPAAIDALEAGKHVLSEVVAFDTIAEGVQLARTVEKSGKVYFFGENFCYLPWVQEMRRLYQSGALGELRYAEGEYMHWAQDVLHLLVDLTIPHHWRLWIPPTFYCTHSVGPILWITGLRPVAVQASVGLLNLGGPGAPPVQSPALELVRLENGALVKSLHGGPYPREPWQPWLSLGGSKGCVENSRWPDPRLLTTYLQRDGRRRSYLAKFRRLARQARQTQHWGADLFVLERFVHAIRSGEKPELDVHLGLDMTLVGNLGWRSVLQEGRWIAIPDLRSEDVRQLWEEDRHSCKPGTPEPFLLPNHAQARTTVLPEAELLGQIRRRQKNVPYARAMYRD